MPPVAAVAPPTTAPVAAAPFVPNTTSFASPSPFLTTAVPAPNPNNLPIGPVANLNIGISGANFAKAVLNNVVNPLKEFRNKPPNANLPTVDARDVNTLNVVPIPIVNAVIVAPINTSPFVNSAFSFSSFSKFPSASDCSSCNPLLVNHPPAKIKKNLSRENKLF